MKTLILSILLLTIVYLSDAQNVNIPDAKSKNPEFKYEYAVKFVCGEQKYSRNFRLAKGLYTTTVNIHNPYDTTAIFNKKLALTYPPEEQQPGRIIQLGRDTLFYDQALKTDGYNVRRQFNFLDYIEGFVIIQSTVSLDVSAVYTAARPTKFIFRPLYKVASIDVESIGEREIKRHYPQPEPPEPDHFKIYLVDTIFPDIQVGLKGQFDDQLKEVKITSLKYFANPTSKEYAGSKTKINDPSRHFNIYDIKQEPEPSREIRFQNQFGQHHLKIGDARFLMVPAQKTSHVGIPFPDSLDHYKCYEVTDTLEALYLPRVSLDDQFGPEQNIQLDNLPECFCVPVKKTMPNESSNEIINPDDYLVIYNNMTPRFTQRGIRVKDQFDVDGFPLTVIKSVMLAVPSEKLEVVSVGD